MVDCIKACGGATCHALLTLSISHDLGSRKTNNYVHFGYGDSPPYEHTLDLVLNVKRTGAYTTARASAVRQKVSQLFEQMNKMKITSGNIPTGM